MATGCEQPFASNHGAGPQNVNSGSGDQTNNTISGGSYNHQSIVSVTFVPPQIESSATPASVIVPRRDVNFIERMELVDSIRAHAETPGSWLALVGLGGVGKTQLAIRYVEYVRERDGDAWILWIFASNAGRFDESIREVANQIRLLGRHDPKANVLQLLQSWLADSKRRWLIVLDNVDDAEFLEQPADDVQTTRPRIEYFPACYHGNMIFTSRNRDAAHKFVDESNVIEILPMDAEHAKTLLRKKMGALYCENSAAKLAAALDFMPLALSQAASYIKQNRRLTVDNYLAELEKSRKSRTSLLRQHGTVPKRDREASSSIILTWQISFEHVHRTRKSAADLLALMSFCDRQAIPELLLHDDRNEKGSESGSQSEDYLPGLVTEFDKDMQMLENFSFVATTTNATTWDMHRLVQDAMQWWLTDRDELSKTQSRLVQRLYAVVPTGGFENWEACRALAPHVRSATELEFDESDVALLWATVMYRAAWYEMRGGSVTIARERAKLALAQRQKLLESDHEDVLWAEAAMAEIDEKEGRYDDAVRLQTKVMESRRRVLGIEHPDTLTSMTNLASIYRRQGLWTEAETLQVKGMETRRRVLGAEHPDTLVSIANLAFTYRNQGRWIEAESLQVEVTETRRRVLGAEHPDTLTSMANLASTYRDQGRRTEAEALQVEVMETRRRVLGVEHPDVLTSMGNLAKTYMHQGRWSEAEALNVECLKTRTKILGAEHPDTLTSMSNLASTYRNQGRWSESETLNVKVVETSRRVLGAEHPHTMTSMHNLASTYRNQRRLTEAEVLHLEVMETLRRVLGAEHPDTLTSMHSLVITYYEQYKLPRAHELMTTCVEARTRKLGPLHPDTKASISWLKDIQSALERPDLANASILEENTVCGHVDSKR